MDRPRPQPAVAEHVTSPAWYTLARNGDRLSVPLGGPYVDLDAAKNDIKRVRSETEAVDAYAHFYTFVSAQLRDPPKQPPLFGTGSAAEKAA